MTRVLECIQEFGRRMYENTLAVPAVIELPPRAFDPLVAECAAMTRQTPRIETGVTLEIQVETGFGIVCVRRTEPVQWAGTPLQGEGSE